MSLNKETKPKLSIGYNVNVLVCGHEVSEFEFQWRNCVHFRANTFGQRYEAYYTESNWIK